MHPVQRKHPLPARYIQATTVDHALAVLAEEGPRARIVAGGTDLLLEVQRGARAGVDVLVDITRIAGLDSVEQRNDGLHLGPLVTHGQAAHDVLIRDRARPLAQACREVGSPALRNRATVAGNIVTASPANDSLSPLLVLDARVVIRSRHGERTVAVADFVTGLRTTVLAPEEMVVDIVVPTLPPSARGVFVKLGNRRAQAISVVHLAAVVERDDDAVVTAARLAVGSVAPTVVTLDHLASALVGNVLTDEIVREVAHNVRDAVAPIDDVRATAAYRTHAVGVMAERAFTALDDDTVAPFTPQPRLTGTHVNRAPHGRTVTASDTVDAMVNGTPISAPRAAGATLLDWLRDEAGLRGTKEGCAEGECGACTVLVDGAAVLSCLVPAGAADGTEVRTVEGLGRDGELHAVQRGFLACGGVQCGFCTPGFLVAGAALLAENSAPDGAVVREAFAGNLCRCTGYRSIVDAMIAAAS